jgi:hypothetical protein
LKSPWQSASRTIRRWPAGSSRFASPIPFVLDDCTGAGNAFGAQLADLEAKRLDQRTELENAIEDLDFTVPVKPGK